MNVSLDDDRAGRDAASPLYRPRADIYDEMIDMTGEVRSHWRQIHGWFADEAPEALDDRSRRVERALFDNFSDPQGGGQPWGLDIAPLAMNLKDWALIEAAALQRARLYNAVLADLYGPQSLFASGALPPMVVLNDPAYLRPLHGVAPDGGHLTFLALDLARNPRGDWRIIDAHAETPAGHGFVLANRVVMGDVSGDLFNGGQARRLGSHYQGLADSLAARAGGEEPEIAILTSAPGDEAFLGHAFMGRYFGYSRVEGSDLRVAENRVFLKTIEGLKRIDLLLKAVEGRRADPIELAPDGFDGPVGLVQAIRAQPGLVVNTLGAAVIENRGLSPFLPTIASQLLGEDLALPDTPRLWLGDSAIRADILRDIDQYVIHEAREGAGRPGQAKEGVRATALDEVARADLFQKIELDGALYVATRPQGFATAPAWRDGALRPEPFALRVFVTAQRGGFALLPGGVALTIDSHSEVAVTPMAQVARSRDVWVIDPVPAPAVSLRRVAAQHHMIQRQPIELQSRAADNLFWLGRYCERADATLRIVRQALSQRAVDLAPAARLNRPLAGLDHLLAKGSLSQGAGGSLHGAVSALCESPDGFYALPRVVNMIRASALQTRERLSIDSWRILSNLSTSGLRCMPAPSHLNEAERMQAAPMNSLPMNSLDIVEGCDALLGALAAFTGMTHENMTRNRGWSFLDIGRRIERAAQLNDLLRGLFSTTAHTEDESVDLIFALNVADCDITYRSRYRFAPELPTALDLLMIDETNPRSLAYQLLEISKQIEELPRSSNDAMRAPEQRIALDLLTRVRLVDLDALVVGEPDETRAALDQLLRDVGVELQRLTEALSRSYFNLMQEQPRRLRSERSS